MRIWGVAGDRLVEIVVEPGDEGVVVNGLPAARCRTVSDRVQAAIANSGLGVKAAAVRAEPCLHEGEATAALDLPIALALLSWDAPAGSDWVMAAGRLGLDGRIHAPDLREPVWLGDVVRSLGDSRGDR